MTALRETAHAKINLALHVRRRRDDGYHDIETIFAFAEHGDKLIVAPADDLSVTITGPFAEGLVGPDNLVMRAACMLRETFNVAAGAAIALDKRLPVASGIGGGSADAAAALRLLVEHWELPFDDRRIAGTAERLGADVPACLLSRTSRAEGLGHPICLIDDATLRGMPLLLVNPGVPLATGSVFRAWDGVDRGGLGEGDAFDLALAGRNDLEPPAVHLVPAIADAAALLARQPGVLLARMSGSGATCFALFEDIAARDAALAVVTDDRPGWWCLASALR